jgi:hypothetical protein
MMQDMRKFNLSSLSPVAFNAIALVFVCIGVYRFYEFSLYTLPQSSDLCWLIRIGEWIVRNGRLPDHALFSWWPHTHFPICYQWLYEIFAYGLDRSFGLWTIGLIGMLSSGAIIFWLLPRQWLMLGLRPAIVYGAVCLIFSRHWMLLRPQLFSCFLLIALLHILDVLRNNVSSRLAFVLPALFLFWANFHLTWSFGLLVLTLFVARAFFTPMNKEVRIRLGLIYVACLASILCNPYGFELVRCGLSFNHSDQFLKVYETKSAFEAPDLQLFIVYAISAIGLIAFSIKRFTWDRSALAFAGLLLGLSVNRFAPFAVLVSWALVGESLASLKLRQRQLTNFERKFATFCSGYLGLVAVLLISALTWHQRCPDNATAFHQFVAGSPQILAMPVIRHKERVFNDPIMGSWMVYTGTAKPLMDNHFDIYEKQMCADVYLCISAEPGWEKILDKYGIESLVIRKRCNLTAELEQNPGAWRKLADDDVITYWEKSR